MSNPADISILDYTYQLPEEKIAQYPLADRHASKLLVWKDGKIEESTFRKLGDYLPAETTLVFNSTRVVNARLHFVTVDGHDIEVFCLGPEQAERDPFVEMQKTGSVVWRCFVGNLRRWKEQDLEVIKEGTVLKAELLGRRDDYAIINFSWQPATLKFFEVLEKIGEVPIPPYLKRNSSQEDKDRYQTVYASSEGSVAAPTAGLHFTGEVLTELREKNIKELQVLLHVGAGTFKPVKSATMQGHQMHAEWMEVSRQVIEELLKGDRKIIAVGTTSLRTIETLYWMGLKSLLAPQSDLKDLEISQWDVYSLNAGAHSKAACLSALLSWMEKKNLQKLVCSTQILIAPPYSLKIADGLVTNFHQPQSTLLLLVASILGHKWKDVYRYALDHDFRFLSYGDSSLLLK